MSEEGKEKEVRVISQVSKNNNRRKRKEEGGERHLLPMHQQQQQRFSLDVGGSRGGSWGGMCQGVSGQDPKGDRLTFYYQSIRHHSIGRKMIRNDNRYCLGIKKGAPYTLDRTKSLHSVGFGGWRWERVRLTRFQRDQFVHWQKRSKDLSILALECKKKKKTLTPYMDISILGPQKSWHKAKTSHLSVPDSEISHSKEKVSHPTPVQRKEREWDGHWGWS